MTPEQTIDNKDKGGETTNSPTHPVKKIGALIASELQSSTGNNVEITIADAPERTGADFGVQLSGAAKESGKNPVEFAQSFASTLSEKYPAWVSSHPP